MTRTTYLVATSLLALGLTPIASAQGSGSHLHSWQKQAALTRSVFGRHGSVSPAPLGCKNQKGGCVPGRNQIDYQPTGKTASRSACALGGTTPLSDCYDVALDELHGALWSGDLLRLFGAGVRARDVFERAEQSSGAPSWLHKNSSDNLLNQFFAQHGVEVDSLGPCAVPSAASDYERYQCLASAQGPSRATYRSAVTMLDHHNDILVNRGNVSGAMERLKKIFEGATGAVTAKMIATDKFDPRLGPGVQRIDLLGKMVYLRAATGDMTADIATENAFISDIKAFVPEMANAPIVEARLALFAAQRSAMRYSPSVKDNVVTDAQLYGDLVDLYDAIEKAAVLADITQAGLGHTPAKVYGAFAATWIARPFDAQLDRWNDAITGIPGVFDGVFSIDGSGICNWFTVSDVTHSWTMLIPVQREEQIWIPDCLVLWDNDCNPDVDGHWETITWTEWVEGPTFTTTVQVVTTESIRDNYASLLNADDLDEDGNPNFVDVDGNGAPDHDYSFGALNDHASIILAGINADDCLSELQGYSGAYNNEFDANELNCSDAPGGSDDCQSSYGGGNDNFIPYYVAVRICPSFVANAVGINSVGLSTMNELTSVDSSCPTLLEYVATVADSLKLAGSDMLDPATDDDGPMDELLADFANEGLLLTAPVAGMFRQRETMAYFSSESLTGCNDTPIADCTGLGVVLARADIALDAIRKGFAVLGDFTEIDRDIHNLVGNTAIATFAADGVDECDDGDMISCLTNNRDQSRALFYRRLREAVATYQSLRMDQLEVLARYMDKMPATCVITTDSDSDGEQDSYSCDTATTECASYCDHFAEALAVVDTTTTEMEKIVGDLEEQKAVLEAGGGSATLATFAGEIIELANSIPVAANASVTSLVRGIDWLGDRKGDWAVVSSSDPATDVAAELSTLATAGDDFAGNYSGWVREYLNTLTKKLDFAEASTSVAAMGHNNAAEMCSTLDGEPAPLGCGMCAVGDANCTTDGLALSTDNPTAEYINEVISDNYCQLSVGQYPDIALNLADASSPDYPGASDSYIDWASENGLAACPELPTLDIDALIATYNGTLVTQDVLAMKAALVDIEWAARDINRYVANIKNATDLFDWYTNIHQQYNAKRSFGEWLADGVICGASVLGALALAIFPEPTGATKAASAAAWIGAGKVCASRFATGTENLFPEDGNLSASQLNFAASLMHSQLREADQIYELIGKIEQFVQRLSHYESLIITFRSRVAEFKRTVAYSNQSLDTLSHYNTFADPAFVQFEEESLNNIRSDFRVYARMVQDVRRKVIYDIGNPLPEGADYSVNSSETYYLPSVAELTILAGYNAGFTSAWDRLNVNTITDSDRNLVATASLIDKVFLDFRLTYGDRTANAQTKFIGSNLTDGLLDDDGDGYQDMIDGELQFGDRGEKAMLGDSRFYDPSDDTASGCAHGRVDMSDYCAVYANTGQPTSAGQCADIRTMPLLERVQLAHLDHTVRSEGIETFECFDHGGVFTIRAGTGSGAGGRFNGLDMPFPNWAADPNVSWQRGLANTFSESYYAAQTKTVQRIMDRYLDGIEDSDRSLSVNAKFYPGHFAYYIDMETDVFEPEADLFNDTAKAAQTQSEQFVGAAVFCSDLTACGANAASVNEGNEIDIVLFGDGYKSNRCRYDDAYAADALFDTHRYSDGSTRQAQMSFKMDHDLISSVKAYSHVTPESTPFLTDALAASWLNARPLHASGMLLIVRGIYKNGDIADNANTWALYKTASSTPTLRVAVDYSYYATDVIVGAANIDLEGFLTCEPNTAP